MAVSGKPRRGDELHGERPHWADDEAALARFTSILRNKPRPVTNSVPLEARNNSELIRGE